MIPDDFMDRIIAGIREQVSEYAELMPRFLIGTPKNGLLVVMAPFSNDREKDSVAQLVREMAKEHDADFVVFVSESWVVSDDNARKYQEGRAAGKWRQVADCPFKQDCVVFIVETKIGAKTGWGMIATTDKKRTLGEVTTRKSDGMSGRFTNLLPKETAQ